MFGRKQHHSARRELCLAIIEAMESRGATLGDTAAATIAVSLEVQFMMALNRRPTQAEVSRVSSAMCREMQRIIDDQLSTN